MNNRSCRLSWRYKDGSTGHGRWGIESRIKKDYFLFSKWPHVEQIWIEYEYEMEDSADSK